MTSSELKVAARRALKDDYLSKILLLIVPLVSSILSGIFNKSPRVEYKVNLDKFVINGEVISSTDWKIILSIVIPIIVIAILVSCIIGLIVIVFQTAGIFNYIEIFRGEKKDINLSQDITRTFRDSSFWKIVLLTIVTKLIFFACIIIPSIAWIISLLLGLHPLYLSFLPIVGIGFSIYLGLSWSQSTYVLYDKLKNDNYKGVWDVLQTAKKLINGYKSKYFLFNLTFIGWNLLGNLFWGLPKIYTMPFTTMSMVTFYEALVQERL
jgi:uncharacterized membrane protein